jgi:restriction endonuclease S subunit
MKVSPLPKGWRLVKFGDLVRKINDRVDPDSSGISRYVAGEHMDSDNLKITRWGTVGDGYLGPAFTMRFQPGQILYGSRRTYLRKVAVADFVGICANTTFVLESKSEELLQEFLPHVMSTERFHEYSISKSKGSVNPYINFVDLNDYEFALPPIAEQHRIIELLSTIDLNKDSFYMARKAAIAQKNALMNRWIFEEEQGVLGKLEDYASLNPGGVTLSEEDPFIPMDALPLLQRHPEYFEQKGTRGGIRAKAGDVLFARITPCLENGKLCQVPLEIDACGGSTELIVIRTKGEVSQDLLFHWATFEAIRLRAANLMIGTTGRQRLMAKDLGSLPFRKLSDHQESQLVESLNQIEKTVGLLDLQLRECKVLEYSLREYLLAGRNV